MMHLGITKLTRAAFYRDHLFSNIAQVPLVVRTRAMLAAIQDFPKLVQEDPAFVEIMTNLPFVSTAQGSLLAPKRYGNTCPLGSSSLLYLWLFGTICFSMTASV